MSRTTVGKGIHHRDSGSIGYWEDANESQVRIGMDGFKMPI